MIISHRYIKAAALKSPQPIGAKASQPKAPRSAGSSNPFVGFAPHRDPIPHIPWSKDVKGICKRMRFRPWRGQLPPSYIAMTGALKPEQQCRRQPKHWSSVPVPTWADLRRSPPQRERVIPFLLTRCELSPTRILKGLQSAHHPQFVGRV